MKCLTREDLYDMIEPQNRSEREIPVGAGQDSSDLPSSPRCVITAPTLLGNFPLSTPVIEFEGMVYLLFTFVGHGKLGPRDGLSS